MAIDFPNSPTNGDIFTSNGRSWSYDTGVWSLISSQVLGGDFGTVVDAKGDLIVGTADNVVSRLAAGTNGYVLTANSATGTGLEWIDAGANVTISATAPSAPSAGDLWFDSTTAATFIYYDSTWVEIGGATIGSGGGAGIEDATPTVFLHMGA
jgi:hypothetical protein